jgi:hypothetical protein
MAEMLLGAGKFDGCPKNTACTLVVRFARQMSSPDEV